MKKKLHQQPSSLPGTRLNKYIAHSGLCSRRKAEEHIAKGLIKVNGKVADSPAMRIIEGDTVTFKDKPLEPETEKVYLIMNKPKNAITTSKDTHGRRTVMDLVKSKVEERVYPVGRLDRETTGLLMLTNDGDLAKKLSHPSYEILKVYQVTLDQNVSAAHIKKIAAGLELEDGFIKVDGVNFIEGGEANEVSVSLHSGRNRIVRRIFEHLGYEVKKLDRVYFGGLTKKGISRGSFRHLTEREVIMLKHFV